MLNNLVNKLAQFFYVNGIIQNEEDIEIYAYGLEIMFASILETGTIILISIFMGQLLTTLAFLLAFIILRTYAGGFHAKTHLKCFCVLGVVYAINLLMLHVTPMWFLPWLSLILLAVSIPPIWLFAPVEDENKPINEKQRKKYRKYSLFILSYQSFLVLLMLFEGIQSYVMLSFIFGQSAAAISLLAVKIGMLRIGGEMNEEFNT